MKAEVVGVGWVNGDGPGLGRTDLSSWPYSGPVAIARSQVFSTPRPHFGRMDLYSKAGVAAIAFALRDAGMVRTIDSPLTSLIASTTHGCLATDIDYAKTIAIQPDPHLFAYTLPSTFLGEASVEFHITGPTVLFTERKLDGKMVLVNALDMISTGAARLAIAGIIDQNTPLRSDAKSGFTGALFLVVSPEACGRSYGLLEYSVSGIAFAGRPISHIADVASRLPGRSVS